MNLTFFKRGFIPWISDLQLVFGFCRFRSMFRSKPVSPSLKQFRFDLSFLKEWKFIGELRIVFGRKYFERDFGFASFGRHFDETALEDMKVEEQR